MKECCEIRGDVAAGQRGILTTVLAINAAMCLLEFGGGLIPHSTALIARSSIGIISEARRALSAEAVA